MTRFSVLKIVRTAMLCLVVTTLFSSCAVDEDGNIVWDPAAIPEPEERIPNPESRFYHPKNHIWVNDNVIDTVTPANSRIEINLAEQRARLYKTGGKKDVLAIETQISSGKTKYQSPTGSFKVLEKEPEKESNLYGKWIDPESGEVLITDGDSREPPEEENAKFEGAPMPYWMRLTPGGVGLHIGDVPDYPASHGCIRVPKQIQPLIYSKTQPGTPVVVMR